LQKIAQNRLFHFTAISPIILLSLVNTFTLSQNSRKIWWKYENELSSWHFHNPVMVLWGCDSVQCSDYVPTFGMNRLNWRWKQRLFWNIRTRLHVAIPLITDPTLVGRSYGCAVKMKFHWKLMELLQIWKLCYIFIFISFLISSFY